MMQEPMADHLTQGPAHTINGWHKGLPTCFACVLAITFEQDVCVSVRVCLVAFPPKRPTHPDRIADIAAQVLTSRPAGAGCGTPACRSALCKKGSCIGTI